MGIQEALRSGKLTGRLFSELQSRVFFCSKRIDIFRVVW